MLDPQTGYPLTENQKNQLVDQWFAEDQYFNPVQDINGDWFIFENEVLLNVNPAFPWVNSLTPGEYVPPAE